MNDMCMLIKKADLVCESVEVRTSTEKRDKTSMRTVSYTHLTLPTNREV